MVLQQQQQRCLWEAATTPKNSPTTNTTTQPAQQSQQTLQNVDNTTIKVCQDLTTAATTATATQHTCEFLRVAAHIKIATLKEGCQALGDIWKLRMRNMQDWENLILQIFIF